MSDSRIRRSASIREATTADRVSLSPKTSRASISLVATVSFSFTIGTAWSFSSSSKVFFAFLPLTPPVTAFLVISTWAAIWLYSAKSF